MTVDDLFRSLDRDRVVGFVVARHGTARERAGYERAWAEILSLRPEPAGMVCRLSAFVEEEDEVRYEHVDVIGIGASGEEVGIEYMPWERWLSMEIDDRLVGAEPEEVLGHILHEMTHAGHDQATVRRAAAAIGRTEGPR